MTRPDHLFDFEAPTLSDQDAVWELARKTDSSGVYLLWCNDYAASSLIARLEGIAVGCIVGRRSYAQPDSLTILALDISPEFEPSQLRQLLLFSLIQRMRERHQICYVTTDLERVDPRLATAFQAVARWLGTALATEGATSCVLGPLLP